MKVCVIGSGYVGLVAGTCLAENGHDVICVDKLQAKIDALLKGEMPIYEPGLEELVLRNSAQKRLRFSTDLATSVRESKLVFIAVGTPPGQDGSADLSAVLGVAREVARAIKEYTVIINKSTVPVGTADKVRQAAGEVTSVPFSVVSNPEFLKEGAAIDDFMYPDRIVVGADDEPARELMRELYEPFVRTESPIMFMDTRSAEMSKYTSNAMLATRISFMNEIANLCEKTGASVDQVRRAVGSDKRIGQKFLFAGIGYGGSCFPKDVKALQSTMKEYGVVGDILNSVELVNEKQKRILFEKVDKYYQGDIKGKHFAVWGLAFKPRTDDMREAPAIVIINALLQAGATVSAFDPVAMHEAKSHFGERITYAVGQYETLDQADALLILTEWNEFRRPDYDKMKSLLKAPVIFDGRNIYEPERMQERGFRYFSIGRMAV